MSDTPPQDHNSPVVHSRSQIWWRRIRSLLIDVAIVVTVVYGVQLWRSRAMVPGGSEAPDMQLLQLGLNGEPDRVVRLDDFAGRPVMVHFWATWCGVCETEISMVNALHRALDGQQATLLTVVDDSDAEDVTALRAYMQEHAIEWNVLLGDRETLNAWRIEVFPTDYFISPNGMIDSVHTGFSTTWGMRWRLWWARS
jgi:thiol-disulfide isomerase/thioredoxin